MPLLCRFHFRTLARFVKWFLTCTEIWKNYIFGTVDFDSQSRHKKVENRKVCFFTYKCGVIFCYSYLEIGALYVTEKCLICWQIFYNIFFRTMINLLSLENKPQTMCQNKQNNFTFLFLFSARLWFVQDKVRRQRSDWQPQSWSAPHRNICETFVREERRKPAEN